MVWINYNCHNETPPEGFLGGSRCMCEKCISERRAKEEKVKSNILRKKYRVDCSRNFFVLMILPLALQPNHVWDIIAEYFTHK